MELKWIIINEDYLNYLRNEGDERIPHSNYGGYKFKPFLGVLFEHNGFDYVTQISHYQQRHAFIKQDLDFIKIFNVSDGKPIAVVNLNYMFPVAKEFYFDVDYNQMDQVRKFSSESDKDKYVHLLQSELANIKKTSIVGNAELLIKEKYENPSSKLSSRCVDFYHLEEVASKYVQKYSYRTDLSNKSDYSKFNVLLEEPLNKSNQF